MNTVRPDAAAAFALHRKTLAALSRSSAAGTGDLQTPMRDLTELATQILDVERASVWRLGADRTTIECGANGEMYGVDRMLSDMTISVPLDEVPARVLSAVETFAGSDQLVDDVTFVVVEVR